MIAVVSTGLGAGAITVSLISSQPPAEKSAIEFYGTNIIITLIVVIVFGLTGYFLWKIYLSLSISKRKKKYQIIKH